MTPQFFYISDISNSSTLSGKSLRKKSMLENFRANVLKRENANALRWLLLSCFQDGGPALTRKKQIQQEYTITSAQN